METLTSFIKHDPTRTIQLSGEIPLDVPNGSILDIYRKRDKSHVIHSYPAKFIPEIPRWIIKKYTQEKQTILDPFVGSGTTLIESIVHGRNAIGCDINPVAQLLSKVKTTKLNKKEVTEEKQKLTERITHFDKTHIKIPHIPNINLWFSDCAQETLSIIKQCIDEVTNENVRQFYLCCFSSIIGRVSTVGSGQILQARRKDFQTKKQLDRSEIIDLFFTTCDATFASLSPTFEKIRNSSCKVLPIDARNVDEIQQSVDAIITSPPYINAIDYIWADKLRLHWLNFCQNDEQRLKLMREQIGTENIQTKFYQKLPPTTGISELDEKIVHIYNATYYKASGYQNKLRAFCTYKFFDDMRMHFVKASKLLPMGGYYGLVIGDNNICKVKIETAKFLEKIANESGLEKEFETNIVLKNRSLNVPRNVNWADQIMLDRIFILKKVA